MFAHMWGLHRQIRVWYTLGYLDWTSCKMDWHGWELSFENFHGIQVQGIDVGTKMDCLVGVRANQACVWMVGMISSVCWKSSLVGFKKLQNVSGWSESHQVCIYHDPMIQVREATHNVGLQLLHGWIRAVFWGPNWLPQPKIKSVARSNSFWLVWRWFHSKASLADPITWAPPASSMSITRKRLWNSVSVRAPCRASTKCILPPSSTCSNHYVYVHDDRDWLPWINHCRHVVWIPIGSTCNMLNFQNNDNHQHQNVHDW